MRIRVLGCSGGIGAGSRTSALLVDDDVLINFLDRHGKLEVGVRPEFVDFSDDGIPVAIDKVEDLGRYQELISRLGLRR